MVDVQIRGANKMDKNTLIQKLQEGDYHIDPLGRLVIDNLELLAEIGGAMGANQFMESMSNAGCSNHGC